MSEVELRPPVSKSDALRAMILADTVGAPSPIASFSESALPSDVCVVRDGLWALRHHKPVIACRDGGAPFRFLLTQAALTPGTAAVFTGTERLRERPHDPLVNALQRSLGPLGVSVTRNGPELAQVETPVDLGSPLSFAVTSEQSSQFGSSLLLGAARVFLRTNRRFQVTLDGPVASDGYLELTCRWLEKVGFELERQRSAICVVDYREVRKFPALPGDWSALTYLLPIAWKTGARVANVQLDAEHPDRSVVTHLRNLGLELRFPERQTAKVEGTLRGVLEVDCALAPDSVPALVALACALEMPSVFTRVAVLRLKESDRVAGLVALVHALGGQAVVTNDSLHLIPPTSPRDCAFDTQGDHRLAMAGKTAAVLLGVKVELSDTQCVEKSFPAFFEQLSGF